MSKQVSLTRKHKEAIVDLYKGSIGVDDLDLQVKVELIATGFLVYVSGEVNYGTLTKEGAAKAQDLLAKVKIEAKS